jgi:hypothetical protein
LLSEFFYDSVLPTSKRIIGLTAGNYDFLLKRNASTLLSYCRTLKFVHWEKWFQPFKVNPLLKFYCQMQCACITCHIYVIEGGQCITAMDDDENSELFNAQGRQGWSRLACQAFF